jgi:hypothetical protein
MNPNLVKESEKAQTVPPACDRTMTAVAKAVTAVPSNLHEHVMNAAKNARID